MTKDNQRQGMAELLALQRTDLPLTPAQAARQRRERAAAEPPAGGEQETGTGAGPNSSLKTRTSVSLRHATSRVASHRNALLAAAGAIAVTLAGWLAVSRRRKNR